MKSTPIKALLTTAPKSQEVVVNGWVKSFRNDRFIALNDGSTLKNIQCVVEADQFDAEILKHVSVGAAIKVTGTLVESQGRGQTVEIQASQLFIHGVANPEEVKLTILSPKRHSLEFLREQAHLRVRTNTFGAIMRVRSALSFAIHRYFNQNGFQYFHAPIITGSDAEGAGEMFKVTTLDAKKPPLNESGDINYKEDFFGKETNLTVSGQLEAEAYAMGLGKVYTFGPTFRAENSNTSRHLAEFWMIEPEVAFNDLDDNMDLAEDFIKNVVNYVLEHCIEDLEFLEERLLNVTYTEAIDILRNSKPNKKKKFKYPIHEWGADLQSEHERFLVEKHFKCPVILYDYPAKIKAFYMRLNEDGKTVRAMDILFPGIGEIVGGSQREERLDVLKSKMEALDIPEEELWWYLDLRKFGTAVHSGFGLGFERLVLFATGMGNIRDVIPFPRTPQNAEF